MNSDGGNNIHSGCGIQRLGGGMKFLINGNDQGEERLIKNTAMRNHRWCK